MLIVYRYLTCLWLLSAILPSLSSADDAKCREVVLELNRRLNSHIVQQTANAPHATPSWVDFVPFLISSDLSQSLDFLFFYCNAPSDPIPEALEAASLLFQLQLSFSPALGSGTNDSISFIKSLKGLASPVTEDQEMTLRNLSLDQGHRPFFQQGYVLLHYLAEQIGEAEQRRESDNKHLEQIRRIRLTLDALENSNFLRLIITAGNPAFLNSFLTQVEAFHAMKMKDLFLSRIVPKLISESARWSNLAQASSDQATLGELDAITSYLSIVDREANKLRGLPLAALGAFQVFSNFAADQLIAIGLGRASNGIPGNLFFPQGRAHNKGRFIARIVGLDDLDFLGGEGLPLRRRAVYSTYSEGSPILNESIISWQEFRERLDRLRREHAHLLDTAKASRLALQHFWASKQGSLAKEELRKISLSTEMMIPISPRSAPNPIRSTSTPSVTSAKPAVNYAQQAREYEDSAIRDLYQRFHMLAHREALDAYDALLKEFGTVLVEIPYHALLELTQLGWIEASEHNPFQDPRMFSFPTSRVFGCSSLLESSGTRSR